MDAFVFLTGIDTAFIMVVIGLVAAFKGMGLTSTWAPAAAILSGVALIGLEVWASTPVAAGAAALHIVVGGIIIGLSACGLYSGASATFSGTVQTIK